MADQENHYGFPDDAAEEDHSIISVRTIPVASL